MNETLSLGRIAGIRVGVNWTVIVVFLLITGGVTAVLTELYPGREPAVYGLAGLAAAVLFFVSLLAHELAHAVVAERNGIRCEGIVLWLFGGVAKLLGEAKDPGTDLRIAGVGPLVSFVVGVLFGALAFAASLVGVTGLALGVLGWLGLINIVLAVFNLVPASPLDGGRILRALLWRRHGDRFRAAVSASRAGRVFGFVLVGAGLARVIFGDLGGLWFVLIGWFVATAANAEEQHARVQDALAGLRVSDVMTADPVSVPPTLTVAGLLDDYIWRNRFSAFPVVDPYGHPSGLVTLNRLKAVEPDDRARLTVSEVAAGMDEVAQASPGQPLTEVLQELHNRTDGRILVIDAGRVVGIVSPRDVARMFELAQLHRRG